MSDERDDPRIDRVVAPNRWGGWTRRGIVRLIASTLSAVLVLIAFEGILRVERANKLWKSPATRRSEMIHTPSADPILIYDLKPNSETIYGGVECAINSLGMRDDEPPREIPDHVPRIVVLGDSVAFGHRVKMDSAFPQLLERRLRKVEPDAPSPIVYNLAVTGYSLAQSVRRFELRAESLKPSLVILSYVMNDPDTADGGLSLYFRPPRSELLSRLASLIRRFSRGGRIDGDYHQFIHKAYATELKTGFDRLAEIARRLDVPVVVAITPLFVPREETYTWTNLHRQIRSLAEDEGFDVIDLLEPVRAHPEPVLSFDMWHPTETGHRLISDSIFEFLREKGMVGLIPADSGATPPTK